MCLVFRNEVQAVTAVEKSTGRITGKMKDTAKKKKMADGRTWLKLTQELFHESRIQKTKIRRKKAKFYNALSEHSDLIACFCILFCF